MDRLPDTRDTMMNNHRPNRRAQGSANCHGVSTPKIHDGNARGARTVSRQLARAVTTDLGTLWTLS